MTEKPSKETFENPEAGLGPFLIRERTKRGLSIEEVADKTKIRIEILDALEKERWQELPPPPYVKGFLKSYSRVLGIQPEEVIAIYDGGGFRGVTLKPISKPGRSGRFFYLFVIPALIGLATLGYLIGPDLWDEAVKKAKPISSGQEPEAPPKEAEIPRTEQRQRLQEEAAMPKTQPQEEKITEETKGDGAADSQPEKEISAPVSGPSDERLILKAAARKRTWIRVTCDGKEPIETMLSAGAEKEFRAREGFELLIGNAGGITLELNGEKLDNLGAPGEVLRLRLPDDRVKRGDKRQGE